MSEREQFESWASEQGLCIVWGNSDYIMARTSSAWSAWQAARAQGDAEPVMELVVSEDRCFSPTVIDATFDLPPGDYKLYTQPPSGVPEGFKIRQNAEGDYVVTRLSDMGAVAYCKESPSTTSVMGWHFINSLLSTNATPPRPEHDWIKRIEDECWDLRCTNEPTGGDDYDVLWHVIEHHMAEPKERTIGTGLTPLQALVRADNPPTQEGE